MKQRGQRRPQFSGNSATIVKKPVTQTPTEQIKRVNLTGLTDDDLFGPAFLYEETEFFTEKKSIPTNPVQFIHGYPVDDYYEESYNYDENLPTVNCFDCGEILYGEEIHNHMEEDQDYGETEYPTYKPPKTEDIKGSVSNEEAIK